jgi:DNA-binding MarR family transcriptional regulator
VTPQLSSANVTAVENERPTGAELDTAPGPGADAELGDQADDFGNILAFAFVTFMDGLEAALAEAGHTPSRGLYGFVLRALIDRPLSLRDLAERLDMTSPGALKIVDALEADGYVERRRSETDGRVRTIGLTARGREFLAVARRFHHRFESELADEVGPEVVAQTRVGLAAIIGRPSATIPRLYRRS